MNDTHAPQQSLQDLFSPSEVEQFSEDDVTAGRAIGKMLSLLFLYTVLAMSLVTWWTFHVVGSGNGAASEDPAAVEEHHP